MVISRAENPTSAALIMPSSARIVQLQSFDAMSALTPVLRTRLTQLLSHAKPAALVDADATDLHPRRYPNTRARRAHGGRKWR